MFYSFRASRGEAAGQVLRMNLQFCSGKGSANSDGRRCQGIAENPQHLTAERLRQPAP